MKNTIISTLITIINISLPFLCLAITRLLHKIKWNKKLDSVNLQITNK